MTEWIRLPATIREAPSVDTFRARLCCIKLSTHTKYKFDAKLINHVRWPPHTCSCNRLSRMWRSDCSIRQRCVVSALIKYNKTIRWWSRGQALMELSSNVYYTF